MLTFYDQPSLMTKEPAIEDLKSGDAQAYKEIYEGYREAFFAFAKAYNLPQEDVVDIYQESVLKLYENVMSRKVTEFSSTIKTYLFSIGKFKIYEALRARKKMMPVGELKLENQNIETAELEENGLTPRQQQLKAQFKKLGERCQHILELFYLQGLRIAEIKEAEGYENENTVKATKSRCLKQLKQLMSPKNE